MHQDNTKAAVKQVQHLTGRKTESRSNKFVWHLPFPVLSSSSPCCYFTHSQECGRCCLDPSSLQGHLAALFIASSLSLVFLGDDADFGETNKSNTIILDPAFSHSLNHWTERSRKPLLTIGGWVFAQSWGRYRISFAAWRLIHTGDTNNIEMRSGEDAFCGTFL